MYSAAGFFFSDIIDGGMMSLYNSIYTMKKHGLSWSIDEVLEMPPFDFKQFYLMFQKDLVEKEKQLYKKGGRR